MSEAMLAPVHNHQRASTDTGNGIPFFIRSVIAMGKSMFPEPTAWALSPSIARCKRARRLLPRCNSLSHENSRLRDDAGAIFGGTKGFIRLEQLGRLRPEGDICVIAAMQCQLDLLG